MRPELERLEQRETPAVIKWTGFTSTCGHNQQTGKVE
jgi:hypothetical protein